MSISIEPKILIVNTSYESTNLIEDLPLYLSKLTKIYETLEADPPKFLKVDDDGAHFEVESLFGAMRFIGEMYLGGFRWYCSAFVIMKMSYDPTTGTLKIDLDAESG